MSLDKETVALDQEELRILDSIRRAAPKHRIDSKLAQTYGVWTVCFRRYCQEKGVPWLWMSSVSDFMDFLDGHPNVSTGERNRALDGIMFYITDVHKKRTRDEADEDASSTIPRSTQSLFAKILLRCDVDLTEALRLRRQNIDLENASVQLPAKGEHEARTLSLPTTLRKGLKHHLKRVEDRTSSTNPLLFRQGKETAEETQKSGGDSDSIEQSTELATEVMKTFGEARRDVEDK